MSEKMPVRLGVNYENPEMSVLLTQYENSVEVPKLTDLSNYWIEMEIALRISGRATTWIRKWMP
ncbi:MAG: hypothetical protein V8Q27_04125 [Eubacteriales bacterium]